LPGIGQGNLFLYCQEGWRRKNSPSGVSQARSPASLPQIFYHLNMPWYAEIIENFRALHMKFFTYRSEILGFYKIVKKDK